MALASRRYAAWLSVIGLFCLAGCNQGPPYGQVQGRLTYQGKPLANVEVQFLPDPYKGTNGPRSTGLTDEEGRYSLTCDNRVPGAVVGNHRVVLRELVPSGVPPEALQGKSPLERREAEVAKRAPKKRGVQIPPRYSDSSQTPLTKQVAPGPQTIDLEIK